MERRECTLSRKRSRVKGKRKGEQKDKRRREIIAAITLVNQGEACNPKGSTDHGTDERRYQATLVIKHSKCGTRGSEEGDHKIAWAHVCVRGSRPGRERHLAGSLLFNNVKLHRQSHPQRSRIS